MKAQATLSDTELATRFNSRDVSAFILIYDRYWAPLYLHARRMLQDEEQARDVVQDVFTNMYTRMGSFELKSTLSSFLYSSVRNGIISLIRKKKTRVDYLWYLQGNWNEQVESTEEYMRGLELKEKIESEIAALPPRMRKVFELSRRAHLDIGEIAGEMGISEGTVKKQMQYALKILKGRLTSIILLEFMAFILWFNSSGAMFAKCHRNRTAQKEIHQNSCRS
ncbi:RNA polymerase sigma factor [Pedobacter paludis]|nr:RNA polymerase sigma-70 factor [Pedobacter paludis]